MGAWTALILMGLASVQNPSSQELRKKLEETRVSVDLDGTLDESVASLSRLLGVPVLVDPGSRDRAFPDKKAALHLSEVRGSSALHWLAELRGLDWDVQDGAVILGSPGGHRQQRFFDLAGLSDRAPAPPAATLDLDRASGDFRLDRVPTTGDKARQQAELREILAGLIAPQSPEIVRRALEKLSEGASGSVDRAIMELIKQAAPAAAHATLSEALPYLGGSPEPATPAAEPLGDLIKEIIAPGTWEGERTLDRTPWGSLVVTHGPEALSAIDALLTALRSLAPPPVEVRALLVDQDGALDDGATGGIRGFLGPEETRALEGKLQALDRLKWSSVEGEESQATALSPGGSYVFRVRVARDRGGENLLIRLEVQAGTRAAEKPGPSPSVDRSLVRFTSLVRIPNGGSTLFRLPGKRALLLSAKMDAGNALVERELGTADAGAAGLLEKLGAALPVDLDFKEATLVEVINFFRRSTRLNFVIDTPALETAEREIVTFQAKAIRPASALPMILRPRGLALSPLNEAFKIGSMSASQPLRVLVTSIRQLVEDVTYEDLANLIKNTVEKGRWEAAEGKAILVTADGLLLVRNDAEMLGKVKLFLSEMSRQEPVVTLDVEAVRVEPGKGREVLGSVASGSLLAEEDARRLRSAPGAVSDRYTLRGSFGKPLALHWQGARSWAGGAGRAVAHTGSDLRAMTSLGSGSVQISLEFNDQFFAAGQEEGRPRISEARIQTSIVLPAGRVAVLELPRSDGKDLFLLVREAHDPTR
jgi:hypothetical protein